MHDASPLVVQHSLAVESEERASKEDLAGLAEVVSAFTRSKDAESARRCVRVFVRHGRDGAPIIVFGWAPS